jgi:inositol-1,3,4-trisphosphate 5/6-kinase/inositol-tetrakisphosphate 1-kinase
MERLRKFISGHPDVAIIDPLESVEQVIDRTKVASLIDSSEFRGPSDFVCVTPKFVFAKEDLVQKWINEEEPIPLRFPVICKPIKACGNRDSHQMVVLPSRAALDEVCDGEWLFQEFLNHDGVIYKAYVLGEFCQVFPRESLPNFPTELEDLSGASAVHFNSHDPISSSMFLADLESKHEEDILTPRGTRQPFRLSVDIALLQDFVKWVAQKLRGVLNLNMFGFDVIRESKTNVLYIVDINYFPSYKGVHDLSELIVRHISRQVSGSPYFILQ